jgi:hypothetical protein
MDLKQHWKGWEKQWLSSDNQAAIMEAGSYRRLNEILQEQARRECLGGKKPFFIGSTWWSPGLNGYKEGHYHDNYMVEGQMRATRIHTAYFAYERVMQEGPRSLEKLSDPTLIEIATILNSLGGDTWPFTLALEPAKIRSGAWQEHPAFKRIAGAFVTDLSLYLDNLEKLQRAYEY